MKLYRADNYYDNMGNLEGFCLSFEEAKEILDFNNPSNVGDGDFGQICEFEVEDEVMEGVDINDTQKMLSEEIWGNGKNYNETYFV